MPTLCIILIGYRVFIPEREQVSCKIVAHFSSKREQVSCEIACSLLYLRLQAYCIGRNIFGMVGFEQGTTNLPASTASLRPPTIESEQVRNEVRSSALMAVCIRERSYPTTYIKGSLPKRFFLGHVLSILTGRGLRACSSGLLGAAVPGSRGTSHCTICGSVGPAAIRIPKGSPRHCDIVFQILILIDCFCLIILWIPFSIRISVNGKVRFVLEQKNEKPKASASLWRFDDITTATKRNNEYTIVKIDPMRVLCSVSIVNRLARVFITPSLKSSLCVCYSALALLIG